MARAKRTERADARRRYRAAHADADSAVGIASTDGSTAAAGTQRTNRSAQPATTQQQPPSFTGAFRAAARPLNVREDIAYLPQESSIFRGLTVEDNIRSVLQAQNLSEEDQNLLLEELLGEFHISHLRRTPSPALSGGERRRVEIARALACRPQFMLLDEPLAGIDPIAVGEIRNLIKYLKTKGIGVLITDHNVRDCLDIVDRAYILHDGKVLMEGTADQIVASEEVRKVYLGEGFSL